MSIKVFLKWENRRFEFVPIKKLPFIGSLMVPKATLPKKKLPVASFSERGEPEVRVRANKKTPVWEFNGAEGRTRTGTWGEPRQILSLVRLPISPLRHTLLCNIYLSICLMWRNRYLIFDTDDLRHLSATSAYFILLYSFVNLLNVAKLVPYFDTDDLRYLGATSA